jgi:hypothetical protein
MTASHSTDIPAFLKLAAVFIALSCAIGYLLAQLADQGEFENWHQLGGSELEAVSIVEADHKTVWIESNDSKVMVRRLSCQQDPVVLAGCSGWEQESELPPRGYHQIPLLRSPNCDFSDLQSLPEPPKRAIDCVEATLIGPEYMLTRVYAALDDGSVWYWDFSGDSLGPIPGRLLFASICAPAVGILLAACSYFILEARRKRVEAHE